MFPSSSVDKTRFLLRLFLVYHSEQIIAEMDDVEMDNGYKYLMLMFFKELFLGDIWRDVIFIV